MSASPGFYTEVHLGPQDVLVGGVTRSTCAQCGTRIAVRLEPLDQVLWALTDEALPPGMPMLTRRQAAVVRVLRAAGEQGTRTAALLRLVWGPGYSATRDRDLHVVTVLLGRLRARLRGTRWSIPYTDSRGVHRLVDAEAGAAAAEDAA